MACHGSRGSTTTTEATPNGHVYAATQASDTQPPVASATITGSGAHVSGETYGGFVTVAGTATDPPPSSGTPTVRCALDPATAPASYDDLGAGSCTPLVTGLGPHTFYVAARDPAGNTSTVVSVSFTVIPVPGHDHHQRADGQHVDDHAELHVHLDDPRLDV